MSDIDSSVDERVIELLHEAYWAEWESAMNYLAWSSALDGVIGEAVGESLAADVMDEISHAQEIATRLAVLDEVPFGSDVFTSTQDYLQPPDSPTTEVGDVITGVVTAEEEAVQLYTELAEVAEEEGDRVTRNLAERLLEDEETHLDEFLGYQQEYEARNA
jgi:bacterioferritin